MLRIIITALLFFSVWPVAAQVLSTAPTNKVALSGERVRIGFSYSVDPDCSSQGEIKSRLLEHPKNGVVEMLTEKGFPGYAKDHPRYKCNETLSDVLAYYYKSREDFNGKDRFVVEVFYPIGSYRKRLFTIDVRSTPVVANDQGGEAKIRSADGKHYYPRVTINGTPVRLMADTGATLVALSAEDARKVGIDPQSLQFTGQAHTANGPRPTAPITLSEITIEGTVLRNVRASCCVTGVSLLGMSALERFNFTMNNGLMVLSPKR